MRVNGTDSEVTGVLLSGGRSSRMGGHEKALLDLGGQPLLLHVLQRLRPQVGRIVINANGDPSRFSGYCLPVVADNIEGYVGPLAGLAAGIEWALSETPEAKFIVSTPSDSPFLPLDLVSRLKAALIAKGAPCAIAASDGARHPVAGLWRLDLLPSIVQSLKNDMRALHRFADAHDCAVAEFSLVDVGAAKVDPFFNINAPADLERARALFLSEAHRD